MFGHCAYCFVTVFKSHAPYFFIVLESAQRRSRRIADQVLYITPDKFLILANNHILKALVVYLLHLIKKPDFLFDQ